MLDVKEPIFCLKALDDGSVGLIDQASTFRRINPKTSKVQGGFKSKLQYEQKIFNLVDISISGNYTVLAVPKRGKAALYLSSEKKLIATIGQHQGEIEAVAFSDNEQYVATGGTDGHSYVYYTQSGAMLFALPPHRDYVSAIAFSPNTHYVATASFDQTIQIKNIASLSDHSRLIGHTSVIKKLLFISNDELLSADREGNLMVWGVKSKQLKKRLPKLPDEITDIAVSDDRQFLFVSTQRAYIALYDLTEGKMLSARYLTDAVTINAVTVQKELLCYGNDAGLFQTFDLKHDESVLEGYVKEHSFLQAYTLVNQNPILRHTQAYEALEDEWNRAYSSARDALVQGHKEAAERYVLPFLKISQKQETIKHLFNDFADFEKFKRYIEEKKYSLAYGLASKFPSYKETKEYAKLEKIWELSFEKAKAVIVQDKGEERAHKLLVQFRAVPEKSKMINELFDQRKAYSLFRIRLAQKDFETVFGLLEKYPFLKEYQEYKNLMHWGDQKFIKTLQFLDEGDYISAAKTARQIQHFPDFANEIASLTQEPEVYITFERALKNRDKKAVYELLEHYPYLADLQAAIDFEQFWDIAESDALQYAAEADIEGIYRIFDDYLDIPYKKMHIATVLKSGMIALVKKSMDSQIPLERLHELLKLYINSFGMDESLKALVNDYSFEHGRGLDLDHYLQGSMERIDLKKFYEGYQAWK